MGFGEVLGVSGQDLAGAHLSWCFKKLVAEREGRGGRKNKESDGTREGEFLRWEKKKCGASVRGKEREKKGWTGRMRVTWKGTRTEVRNQVGRGREEGKKAGGK